MEIQKTKLPDVLLIKPPVFEDFRGEYLETYNEKEYTDAIKQYTGKEVRFVQDNFSTSIKNVLRGFHGDPETWKLISCDVGRIYVVIVNCDESSPEFGKWASFNLSDKNRLQVLVPPKHGTAHLVMSDWAMFRYKQSTYYNPTVLKQFTYRYDDPKFKVWWPIKNPILSERDEMEK
jgi:dTDP-4-dehydrorhamnose 3,5-epimerase